MKERKMKQTAGNGVVRPSTQKTARVTVESFTSFEELAGYRQIWDELVVSSNGGAFMSFDWVTTWWQYYSDGRDLRVYVFRANNNIVGILPVFMETIPRMPFGLRVIKVVGSDFSPVTIGLPVLKEYIQDVISQLLAQLEKDFGFELLYLGEISALYPNGKLVSKALEMSGNKQLKVICREGGPQTLFSVTNSLNEQISQLGRRERKKIRRNLRAINEGDSRIETSYADMETFSKYYEEFTKLHQMSWQERGRPGHFLAWPSSMDFHRSVASKFLESGKLWLQKITFDSKTVGLLYSFVMGDVLYEYLDGRDLDFRDGKLSFSRLSFVMQMERAMDKSICFIDSMRGEYDYKLVLGGYLAPTMAIFASRNTFGVASKLSFWSRIFRINHILYYRIWRARIAPRFGIGMKPLQRFWIKSSMLTL